MGSEYPPKGSYAHSFRHVWIGRRGRHLPHESGYPALGHARADGHPVIVGVRGTLPGRPGRSRLPALFRTQRAADGAPPGARRRQDAHRDHHRRRGGTAGGPHTRALFTPTGQPASASEPESVPVPEPADSGPGLAGGCGPAAPRHPDQSGLVLVRGRMLPDRVGKGRFPRPYDHVRDQPVQRSPRSSPPLTAAGARGGGPGRQ